MTNWQAGLIHLGISVPVVAGAAGAMALVWFPPPLFQAAGGSHLILILACVDVVIGPVLTTLVYKPGKPRLKTDLAVIGLIQVCALLYGAHTIFLARPAYVVFSVNQFEVVTAADIPEDEQLKAHDPQFKNSPLGRFRVVAAQIPADPAEQQRILFASFVGHDLAHFPQHYVEYERARVAIAKRCQPLSKLKQLNPGREQDISMLPSKFARTENGLGFLPVRSLKQDFAALIDCNTGELLDFRLFAPW